MKYLITTIITTLLLFTIINCSDESTSNPALNTIINHQYTNANLIPYSTLSEIKNLDTYFQHASVGGNIVAGLIDLMSQNSNRYGYNGTSTPSSIWYQNNNGFGDNNIGNPGFSQKVDTFYSDMTNNNFAANLNIAMMKFCYIDNVGNIINNFNYYKTNMEKLEQLYQNTIFIWWTMPITTTGSSSRDEFNNLVRNYCISNNKILFDIADIECHALDGSKITNSSGFECLDTNYTSDGGHLDSIGRQRVAHGWWCLLAYIKGWKL